MKPEFMIQVSLIKRLYDQCMELVLSQYDIKRTELDILLFLANHPQLDTASDIIHHRGLAKSHVSTSIQHLIMEGLLSSHKSGSDRKKIHLHIEDKAEDMLVAGKAAQAKFFQTMVVDFTKEEIDTLTHLFDRMEHNIRNAVN